MRTISANDGYNYVSVESTAYEPLNDTWGEWCEQKSTTDVDVEAFLNDLFGAAQ